MIIEESLEDRSILKDVKISSTKVEQVKEGHKTPWIRKWTLHTIEVPEEKAEELAWKTSKALDSHPAHPWYADWKNAETHFIIFYGKVFKVRRTSKEEYDAVKAYGLSLGIPEYQIDFHPEVKEWER